MGGGVGEGGGGEKVMTRARECAGRRGEGRVSGETAPLLCLWPC